MDKKYLNLAFDYAKMAFRLNEVPIGAVIVMNGSVIGVGYNRKEESKCVLEHAELIAIREASKIVSNWRLDGADIYVTLDPCPMCASAIKQARISNVYSACNNSDSNNLTLINNIFKSDTINKGVNFISNLNVEESQWLLKKFFDSQRKK